MIIRKLIPKSRIILLFLLIILNGIKPSYAVHTVEGSDLTELEWLSWPEWCKAGFIASEWARTSPYRNRMNQERVKVVREDYSRTYGISGPHHLCLAMVYIERAKLLPEGGPRFGPRDNLTKKAINELSYSYSRTKKEAGGMSFLSALRGTAFYLDNQFAQAMLAWNEGIRLQPHKKESYLAMAEAQLLKKQHKDALKTLLQYKNSREVEEPDGEYLLARAFKESGDTKSAAAHAIRANELGHPHHATARFLINIDENKKALDLVIAGLKQNPTQSLRKLYLELGGKKPYPEVDTNKNTITNKNAESFDTKTTAIPTIDTNSGHSSDGSAYQSREAVTTTGQTDEKSSNPYCRFCP